MRLIDAELVMDKVDECFDTCDQLDLHFTAQDVINIIESAPTVEVEPITHGHWIINELDGYNCSICNATYYCKDNYCGSCGAKMDDERKWV